MAIEGLLPQPFLAQHDFSEFLNGQKGKCRYAPKEDFRK